MRFEVLTAVKTSMLVFREECRVDFLVGTNDSQECTASIYLFNYSKLKRCLNFFENSLLSENTLSAV